MNWFSEKFGRNTTGNNLGGNTSGPTFTQVSVRPLNGAFQPHAALPPASRLNARVDNVDTAGVPLGRAKEYVAQCERPFVQHPGPLNARTDGRGKHYFKSAASAVGTFAGIGRGRTPHQEGEWTRPDRPVPVKINTGEPGLARKLFESPAQRAARRDVRRDAQANVTARVADLMGGSQMALRRATDTETALAGKAAQVGEVRKIVEDGIEQARDEYATRLRQLDDVASCRARHRESVENLQGAAGRLTLARNRHADSIGKETAAATERASIQRQRKALLSELAKLPPAAATAAPASGQPTGAALQQLQAAALLAQTQTDLAGHQAQLALAETELAAAKKHLKRAVIPRSHERGMAKRRVDLNQASVDRLKKKVAEGQAQAAQLADPAAAGGVLLRHQTLQERHAHQRRLVELQVRGLQRRLEKLDAGDLQRSIIKGIHASELHDADKAHAAAQQAEFTCRIEREAAERAVEATRQRMEALPGALPALDKAAAELAEPLRKAHAEADTERRLEENRLQLKLQTLAAAPPGFAAAAVTPELQAGMRRLADRLDEVPIDMRGDTAHERAEAEELRKLRLPRDQAMEIVSRAVALATQGDAARAAAVLDDLMGRRFEGLVPLQNMDFNGQLLVQGGPSDDGDVKRAASLLAARPSGGELLQRVARAPATTPSRHVQDAVAVYYRATNAMAEGPPDRQTADWLACAERASKQVVHPSPQAAADPMGALRNFDRQAFNGVRNGLTSVAPGSAYDHINRSLKQFTEQWIPDGADDNRKTSPLHARRLATKVAADVGLPTVENGLHSNLKSACDKLLLTTQAELGDARTRVNLARQAARAAGPGAPAAPMPEVPESLIRAKHLLQYIQKHADRGERIDTLKLGTSAWRAIEKKTQAELKQERAAPDLDAPARPGAFASKVNGLVERAQGRMRDAADRRHAEREAAHGTTAGDPPPPPSGRLVSKLVGLAGRVQGYPREFAAQSGELAAHARARIHDQVPAARDTDEERGRQWRLTGPQNGFEQVKAGLSDLKTRKPTVQEAKADWQLAQPRTSFALVKAGLASLSTRKPTVQQALSELRDKFQEEYDLLDVADPGHGSRMTGALPPPVETGETLEASAPVEEFHDDPPEHAIDNMTRRESFMEEPDPAALAGNRVEVQEHRDHPLSSPPPSSSQVPEGGGGGDTVGAVARPREPDDEIGPATPRPLHPERPAFDMPGLPLPVQEAPAGARPSEAASRATTQSRQERALADADQALDKAHTLKGHIDRFISKDGDFSAEALRQWMIPSITNAFGAVVAVNHGKQFGIGTSGVIGVASQIGGAIGLVIRPDVEVQGSQKDQFRFARDALGFELSVGRTRGASGSFGVTAGLGQGGGGTGTVLVRGPGATLTHTFAGTNSQGGAVMRAPKFDGRSNQGLTEDFSEMVSTLLTWNRPRGVDGEQRYPEPLHALLDNHPTVSLSTVESAKVRSHTATLNIVGLASPGGPAGEATAGANFFAGIVSSKSKEKSRYKTEGGTQGFVAGSKKSTHTLSGTAGLNQVFGAGGDEHAKLRARVALAAASVDWKRSSALSGANMVSMPDGSMAAERFVEYNSYEKFEKAVNLHRDKWIEHGIRSGKWPSGFPQADKRILVEREFDDFMAKAKASVKAGTVTLQENMDVKPEVGARLSANVALEELARLEGRDEEVMALQVARQKILSDDSSYQPFRLKAIVRSSISQAKGLNVGLSAMTTQGANAQQMYDWFPRQGT